MCYLPTKDLMRPGLTYFMLQVFPLIAHRPETSLCSGYTKVQTEPGAQLRTSARSTCHPKPQGRNRSESGCSGAKAPERGCVASSSSACSDNYPSVLHTPTTHTLTFCKSGFGICVQTYQTRGGSAAALMQGNHCKVSKLLCGRPTLALKKEEEEAGPQPSSLPAFSIVIGNPSPVYPSPRLAQSPSRTRLECARALSGSLKLEVTFWLPWYSQSFTAGPS